MSDRADGAAYPSQRRAWLTLGLLAVAYLVGYVDRQVLGLLVGPIKADLGVGDFQMSLLVGLAFALFYSFFGVPIGRLADRVDRKRLLLVGVVLWSLATMGCGFAGGFATLFVCRIAIGIGEATLAPASYSLIGDLFPPQRLVRATSFLALAATLSAGLALVIGGQAIVLATAADGLPFGLGDRAPWQRTFLLVGLPGLLLALVLFLLVREPARRRESAADDEVKRDAFGYLWQHRRDYLPIYLTAAGMAVQSYGGLLLFPTHLIRVFGVSASEAGTLIGTVQIVGSIAGTFLGVTATEWLTRRGYADAHLRTVMIAALTTAALMATFLAPGLSSTIGLWLLAVTMQGTYYGNLSAALQLVTPGRARGTTIALFYLTINVVGLAGGTALMGAIAQYVFPGTPRGLGYGIALVGGGGALLGALAAWRGLPQYRRALERLR